MLFTAYVFWIFFAIVLGILLINQILVRSIRFQNLVLLVASYVFYGFWDWRFLVLILICTVQTYYLTSNMMVVGNLKDGLRHHNKILLWTSVLMNLGILACFKYLNFFYSETVYLLNQLGYSGPTNTLEIILPVGISFYIFQSLTYVIDVYRGKFEQETSFINYATFVAFFPQLVAGPIERARNLLPQFRQLNVISENGLVQGVRLIIFGLFLKVVIADNLASFVDDIFNEPERFNGGVLALGAVYFAAQIYGDFCGYSMIAIGVASCMGFRLMTNFDTPYLSISFQDFWRRWHISLSSFFRDYVYIPLGGSKQPERKVSRNLVVTFAISGLWHGANWTFLLWGFMHGLLVILQRNLKLDSYVTSKFPRVKNVLFWCITMYAVVHLWIFFRAESLSEAVFYMKNLYMSLDIPDGKRSGIIYLLYMAMTEVILFRNNRLENQISKSGTFDSLVFVIMIVLISDDFMFSDPKSFIYFQF